MRFHLVLCAAALAAMVPAAALADDPRDPAMRSAAARARDHEATRQLNLRERAMVRHRDARYAQDNGSSADYARNRAQYERDMAEWRRAVAECRNGDYSACGN